MKLTPKRSVSTCGSTSMSAAWKGGHFADKLDKIYYVNPACRWRGLSSESQGLRHGLRHITKTRFFALTPRILDGNIKYNKLSSTGFPSGAAVHDPTRRIFDGTVQLRGNFDFNTTSSSSLDRPGCAIAVPLYTQTHFLTAYQGLLWSESVNYWFACAVQDEAIA